MSETTVGDVPVAPAQVEGITPLPDQSAAKALFAGKILHANVFPYPSMREADREVLEPMVNAIDSFMGGRAEDLKRWDLEAGQPAEFSLLLINPGRLERFALRVTAPGMAQPEVVDLAPAAEQLARIALPTHRRGRMPIPRLKLWTEFPLGLWRVWAYWQPSMSVLVYPTPETPGVPLPAASAHPGDGQGIGGGEEDVAAVRPYQPGDSPRRIAWRAVARSGSDELLTKQFEGGERGELWLDWSQLPAQLDVESRLSRLARWVIDADAAGARWALRLPGTFIELDGGGAHRQRCLEALALAEL